MYNCQYRLPDGVCHGDHSYVEHIRSLPESERTATHNLDGTPIPAWRRRALAGDNVGARDLTGSIRS